MLVTFDGALKGERVSVDANLAVALGSKLAEDGTEQCIIIVSTKNEDIKILVGHSVDEVQEALNKAKGIW